MLDLIRKMNQGWKPYEKQNIFSNVNKTEHELFQAFICLFSFDQII